MVKFKINRNKLRLLKGKLPPKELTIKQKKAKEEDDQYFRNQTSSNEYSCWQTPPLDIMEHILKHVNVGDQIRLRITCKYWKSIAMRRDITSAPHELPWLLLPQAPKHSNNCLSFASLSERKIVKLKLPDEVGGSWIYGSSKGWLIMVKQNGLESTLCLHNPISGALHKFPPLSTLPSFETIVGMRQWKRFAAKIFLLHVALLTPHDDIRSSGHCSIAIVFEDMKGHKTLGLCKLGDLRWSVFQVLDINDDMKIADILFSQGILYVLVDSQMDGFVAANFKLQVADIEVKLKVIHNKHEHKNVRGENKYYGDYLGVPNANYRSILLKSNSNEVLLIHQMQDYVLGRTGVGEEISDDEFEIDETGPGLNPRIRTRSFRVYKIDPNNNNLVPLQNLGDQMFFIGDDGGSISLPASNFTGVERNCVCFATNYIYDLEEAPKIYRSREIGMFYLDGEKVRRPFRSVKMSVLYQASWFTPSL